MGYLPPNLSMMELVNRIDKNAKARVSQYGLPWANRMYGVADGWEDEDSASPLIQRYTPAVYPMDVGGRGRDFRRQGIGDNRSSGDAPGSTRDTYQPWDLTHPRRRYARPDHNRRKLDPSLMELREFSVFAPKSLSGGPVVY